MSDLISLLFVGGFLGIGGISLYLYKNEDEDNTKEVSPDIVQKEETNYNNEESFLEDKMEYDFYQPKKKSLVKSLKSKKKTSGTKRRY